MLPLPTSPHPERTKSPRVRSPTFRAFQKSPHLPLRLFSTPQITSIAQQSTLRTSRKTQTVHENSVSIPLQPRTHMCTKPPSHQNPIFTTTEILSSPSQTMPLSSRGVALRLSRVSLASTTDQIPMARIILRPGLFRRTFQLSLKPKKTSMLALLVWCYRMVWSFFRLWFIHFVSNSFCHTGSVSSDSDTDSTITEGPYNGQDSAPDAMHRYYAMMSSRPVSEDRRLLPPPVQSQPQNGATTPRTSISPPGIVNHSRHSAPVQRRQEPMPRDSLVLPPPAPMQHQDSGYGGRTVRRSSLEREQRAILPPGLSTSPTSHSQGQPPAPAPYGGRLRRDSLTQARRDSISNGSQPPIQQSGRRDSFSAPQPPSLQSIHRNSISAPPLPVRRATDPLPITIPPPPVSARRSSESAPRGQGLLVSTRVRFDDENLICPSPIPRDERRQGFYNRRGYVLSP